MAAAVLADLPPGKGLEEEIEAELGSGASKVWKEVKLLLQPQGKCENKEHAGKVEGEEEFVCEEADCLLIWLEDKTFSVTLVSHTKIHLSSKILIHRKIHFSSKILIQTVASTIAVHAF